MKNIPTRPTRWKGSRWGGSGAGAFKMDSTTPTRPPNPPNAIFTATIFTAKESPQLSLSVYWLRHRREMSFVSSPALRVPTRLRGGTKFNPIQAPCQMVLLDVLFGNFLVLCQHVRRENRAATINMTWCCQESKEHLEVSWRQEGQRVAWCPFAHIVHVFGYPGNMYS